MLYFDANPIRTKYLVTEFHEQFDHCWNNIKQKEFELFLCQNLKNNICDIRLIPLDHVTYLNRKLFLRERMSGNSFPWPGTEPRTFPIHTTIQLYQANLYINLSIAAQGNLYLALFINHQTGKERFLITITSTSPVKLNNQCLHMQIVVYWDLTRIEPGTEPKTFRSVSVSPINRSIKQIWT